VEVNPDTLYRELQDHAIIFKIKTLDTSSGCQSIDLQNTAPIATRTSLSSTLEGRLEAIH